MCAREWLCARRSRGRGKRNGTSEPANGKQSNGGGGDGDDNEEPEVKKRGRKRRRPSWLGDSAKEFEALRNVCPYCDKSFPDERRVAMHVRNAHRKPFKCDLCRRQYFSQERLELHRSSHLTFDGHFQCSVCHLKYKREESLQSHYVRAHLDVEPSFGCDHCGKKYKLKHDLMLHINQVHMGSYQICRFCGKNVKYVKAHEWRHQNKIRASSQQEQSDGLNDQEEPRKIFPCKLCFRKLRSESQLENHLMRHVQSYPCDKCGKTFPGPAQLMNHKSKHRPGTTCIFCDRYFSSRSNYYQHVLMHARIRPYKCDVCYESFTQRSTLVRHRKAHPQPFPKGEQQVPIAELARRILKNFDNMSPIEAREKIESYSMED